jgi:TIR domain
MPEAVPEGYIKPFVFISYASEDQAIASVIDDALKELDYSLDIFRDAHNLERGLSLTDQIYDALEKADFLLIIYTERLKKSHSFTGVEAAHFGCQNEAMQGPEQKRSAESFRSISTRCHPSKKVCLELNLLPRHFQLLIRTLRLKQLIQTTNWLNCFAKSAKLHSLEGFL